jgi:hypothetical protein
MIKLPQQIYHFLLQRLELAASTTIAAVAQSDCKLSAVFMSTRRITTGFSALVVKSTATLSSTSFHINP